MLKLEEWLYMIHQLVAMTDILLNQCLGNNFFYTLNDEEIKTAEIRMNHGNKCNIKIPINPLTPRTIVDTIDCSLIGNEYTVKVNANQGGFM